MQPVSCSRQALSKSKPGAHKQARRSKLFSPKTTSAMLVVLHFNDSRKQLWKVTATNGNRLTESDLLFSFIIKKLYILFVDFICLALYYNYECVIAFILTILKLRHRIQTSLLCISIREHLICGWSPVNL